MVDRPRRSSRTEKLRNILVNHSTIFMGLFEEELLDFADALAEIPGLVAEGKDPKRRAKAHGQASSDVRLRIEEVVSGIREEAASQFPKGSDAFTQYVSRKAFDPGIKIVESYDFELPRLTEDLGEGVLASYVFLLQGGDKELTKMFQDLAEWRSNLPKPPSGEWTSSEGAGLRRRQNRPRKGSG